jgi:CheY-like chemotaxis protein
MIERNGYLYIDDDQFSRDAMKIIVQRGMRETLTLFEDTTNFMQRLQALSQRPQVILLDIHMQPHDGFAVLEMLRTHPGYQDIPVVALTASVMNEEVQKLNDAGFNGVIAKPFSVRSLPGLLKRIQDGEPVWNIVE